MRESKFPSKMLTNKVWVLYILVGMDKKTKLFSGHTYIGISTDLKHRLRAHNSEIRGGALRTTMFKNILDWEVCCIMKSKSFDTSFVERLEKLVQEKGKKRRRQIATLEKRKLIQQHIKIPALRGMFEALCWEDLQTKQNIEIQWVRSDFAPPENVRDLLTPNMFSHSLSLEV